MAKYNIPALVTVAGMALPEPSTYSANTVTVVNQGRSADGKLIADVIRDDLAKVSLTWSFLTASEWAQIQSLFRKDAGGKFANAVKFFSQSSGQYETRPMYISDRNAGMWRRDPDTLSVLGWTECSLSLIEV